jgi:translation initiation factor 2D
VHLGATVTPPGTFPMTASTFYSSYVLFCRPAEHTLDVKKSTYKKLSKFLCAMEKEGLLGIKGINDDVKVVSVKMEHPKVVEHKLQLMRVRLAQGLRRYSQ